MELTGVQSGNALVLCFMTLNSQTVSGITDTAGNSYSSAVALTDSGGRRADIWRAFNVIGGNLTLTITKSSTIGCGLSLYEIEGVTEVSATGSGSIVNLTAHNVASAVANTQADSVFIAATASNQSVTATAGDGYTADRGTAAASFFHARSKEVTAIESNDASWTSSGACRTSNVLAVFG